MIMRAYCNHYAGILLVICTCFFSSTNVARADMVGCWRFDEGSGTTAADSSGNGNDGTLTNMVPGSWTTGKYGGALYFDGSDDYVDCGTDSIFNFNNTNAFTISCWIRPRNLSSYQGIIGKWSGGWAYSPYQIIVYTDGRIKIGIGNGITSGCIYLPTENFSLGQWYHIAATYDGSVLRGYVNGKEKASAQFDYTLATNSSSLKIGDFANTYFFNGDIDDVRLYGLSLNASQINDQFNNLRGRWKMNDGSGATIVDSLGNNNGILINMVSPWVNGILDEDGYFRNALYFDGSDDYADCGTDSIFNFNNTNAFTISCWIRPNNLSSYQGIIGKWLSGWAYSPYQIIVYTDGRIKIGIGNGTTSGCIYLPAENFSLGQWRHIAATYDGSVLRGYVNGKEKASAQFDYTLATNSSSLKIGNFANTYFFNGDIDDVRLYGLSLSENDIKNIQLLSAFPNRNYYTTEGNATAVAELNISSDEGLANCYLAAKDSQGNTLGTNNSPGKFTDLIFTTTSLINGTNSIDIELRKSSGELVYYVNLDVIKRAANTGNEVKVDTKNNMLLRNGSGFFPIGVFMYSITSDRTSDFETVANAGFNSVIRWDLNATASDSVTYLENADDYDLLVVDRHESYPTIFLTRYKWDTSDYFWDAYISLDENDDTQWERMIDAVAYAKQQNNLLGYYTFDEPEDTQLAAGPDLYTKTNNEDGYHPTFVLYNRTVPEGDAYTDWCDVLGYDPYWIPPGTTISGTLSQKSINWVTKHVWETKQRAMKDHKALWIALCAEYFCNSYKRPINAVEQRCQTFLALIHGAKAIFYFRYPVLHESSLTSLTAIATDLNTLAPIMLTDDLAQQVTYSTGETFDPENNEFPSVQCSLRKAPSGAAYDYVLLAANTQPFSVNVSFDVSLLGTSGSVGRIFSQDTFTVTNGQFGETLEPYGTRAYTFSSASTDPVSIDMALTLPDPLPAAEESLPVTGRTNCTNLMQNPTLENTSFAKWPDYCWPLYAEPMINTQDQGWGLVTTSTIPSPNTGLPATSGSTCLKMTRDGNTNGMYFRLSPQHSEATDQDYTFSLYLKAGQSGTRIHIGSSVLGYVPKTITDSWARYEVTFAVPPNLTLYNTFYIYVIDDGDIWVDAVQVEAGSSASVFTTD